MGNEKAALSILKQNMVYQLKHKYKTHLEHKQRQQKHKQGQQEVVKNYSNTTRRNINITSSNSSNHSNISCSSSELSQHIWINIRKQWTCVLMIKAGLTVMPSYLPQIQDANKVKQNGDAETNHNFDACRKGSWNTSDKLG